MTGPRASRSAVLALAVVALGELAGCPARGGPTTTPTGLDRTLPDPQIAGGPARPERPAPTPPAAPADATPLAAGAMYQRRTAGSGAQRATGNDRVTVRYRSWSPEGMLADYPAFVGELPRLPTGIVDAVAIMAVGEHGRLWVPAVDTHDRAADPIVIDLELVGVQVAPVVPADVARPPRSAKTSRTGIRSIVVTPGTGTARPNPNDNLSLHFTGWDATGLMVETTAWDGSPRNVQLRWLPGGLQEAVGGMVVGETARFWIPIKLTGYNDGSDGVLTYEVTLVSLEQLRPPPKTPKDVARPPRGAKKTARGVRYRFLTRGKSRVHPGPTANVRVHYSGWTTDGALFDSSITRNAAATFPLNGVIPGWTDVVQVMAPGDTIRAWIPEALAYKGQPGMPAGMLVFDIELLGIEE